jgi:uncharacterized protein YndB with AHSA1/START domain
MPGFELSGYADAPVEEVWKLLFDPSRFPEWWAGVATVRPDGTDAYVMWPEGYPDFPMPQRLRAEPGQTRVTISCQVSDIDVVWQLGELGTGSSVDVRVDLPEAEAHRLAAQHEVMQRSLASLARLAEASAAPR